MSILTIEESMYVKFEESNSIVKSIVDCEIDFFKWTLGKYL